MSREEAAEAKRIEEEASLWVVKRDRGLDEDERREFDQWLRENPQCREQFDRYDKSWDFFELTESRENREESPQREKVLSFPFYKKVGAWGVVAALVAVGFFVGMVQFEASEDEYLVYKKAEEIERSHLPDGSLVAMNVNTEAAFKIDSDERTINLLSGEAHFDVAKDRDRPFVVMAGEIEIRAIGTSFNVRYLDDGIEVLVTEGIVQLSRIGEANQDSGSLTQAAHIVLENDLIANEVSMVPFDREEKAIIEKLDTSESFSRLDWKSEILEFENALLSEVIEALNANNRTRIELSDQKLGERLIDISIRSDRMDEFVELVSLTHGLRSEQVEDGLIVLRMP